jgi:hypothetical protein
MAGIRTQLAKVSIKQALYYHTSHTFLQQGGRNPILKDARSTRKNLDPLLMCILQRSGGLYTGLKPDTTDPVLVGFFQDGLGD